MEPDDSANAFEGLVGDSKSMRRLFECLRRVAPFSTPVLLVGETGTGKDLAARAIHQVSSRRPKPFVAVNCAALPHDLVESELFGHRRGAFSGATGDHHGLFRAADGGTLFLDEITEMKPNVQAKLLRVLQQHAVRPIGSTAEIPVDVRIIAATNQDPQTAVAQGVLRQDLYYRLCVHTIPFPALRDRLQDIPSLVEHHLCARMNGRASDTGLGVTPEALDWLMRQPWPGNVRELFNTIERAAAFCCSTRIGIDAFIALPPGGVSCQQTIGTPAVIPSIVEDGGPLTLKEAEHAAIRRALQASGGTKLVAARLLGISRKTLYKKLAKGDAQAPRPKPATNIVRLSLLRNSGNRCG